MDGDKSLLETFTDTLKAAAGAIAHPTAGTPMAMPLNESGYAITHLRSSSTARKKAAGKKAVKPSTWWLLAPQALCFQMSSSS